MSKYMKEAILRLKWLATFSGTTWRDNTSGKELTLPDMIRQGDFFYITETTGVDVGNVHYMRGVGNISCIDNPNIELVDLLDAYLETMEKGE